MLISDFDGTVNMVRETAEQRRQEVTLVKIEVKKVEKIQATATPDS
jgi:hypothetical protein